MLKTFLILIYLAVHPVHVSLLSIDYSEEDKSFNVFLKLYYDDFLLDAGGCIISGGTGQISENDIPLNSCLFKYIEEKIDICVNNHTLKGESGDLQLEDNELKINLKYGTSSEFDSVMVRNRIMAELYNDQANMVIVRVKDFEEGFKFTPSVTQKTFRIK
ncbi:MAG: hypothetical protein RBR81_03780 [Bacteroidales bacterium]|jgi:hypothetical protein|nr:hypothetical protein [Bacteroidales bacterium]